MQSQTLIVTMFLPHSHVPASGSALISNYLPTFKNHFYLFKFYHIYVHLKNKLSAFQFYK